MIWYYRHSEDPNDQSVTGMDIDIIKSVAKHMGFKCKFRFERFEGYYMGKVWKV